MVGHIKGRAILCGGAAEESPQLADDLADILNGPQHCRRHGSGRRKTCKSLAAICSVENQKQSLKT
jgi:hypothetical protein